jgi:hypothetical protein
MAIEKLSNLIKIWYLCSIEVNKTSIKEFYHHTEPKPEEGGDDEGFSSQFD